MTRSQLPGGLGRERVFLVGMMGAGKSTAARALAERLGWPLLDTDGAVEQRRGLSVAQLFAEEGEGEFRAEESRVIEDVAKLAGPIVVSVGGGAIKSEANRRTLHAAGTVVWLRARTSTLAARVGGGHGRPLLAGASDGIEYAVGQLAEERRVLYAEVADLVVDVDEMTAPDVAALVVDRLGLGFDRPA